MIISDLQFYDISWKHRFESLSLRQSQRNELWKQQVALIFRLRAHQICARIFQVIEQTSLIHLTVLLVIAKHDKTKKRHKRTLCGKSDWEKTCDDGGKFFGW